MHEHEQGAGDPLTRDEQFALIAALVASRQSRVGEAVRFTEDEVGLLLREAGVTRGRQAILDATLSGGLMVNVIGGEVRLDAPDDGYRERFEAVLKKFRSTAGGRSASVPEIPGQG